MSTTLIERRPRTSAKLRSKLLEKDRQLSVVDAMIAQEVAAFDRRAEEIIQEMFESNTPVKTPKKPK